MPWGKFIIIVLFIFPTVSCNHLLNEESNDSLLESWFNQFCCLAVPPRGLWDLFPDPGLNLGPLQWDYGTLTTGFPRNSLNQRLLRVERMAALWPEISKYTSPSKNHFTIWSFKRSVCLAGYTSHTLLPFIILTCRRGFSIRKYQDMETVLYHKNICFIVHMLHSKGPQT